VQHYVEQVATPHHVRVTSVSDAFAPSGDTTLGVAWELMVTRASADTCTFTNRVIVSATAGFLAELAQAGVTDLAPVRAHMTTSTDAHNRDETPQFARDIEGKALAGVLS
jgi:hypothetical protein